MIFRSNKQKENPDKIFYSMGELAEMFNVNVSLIRYWENEFDILNPKRNAKGNRLFSPKDVDNLHLIYHLVKEKGMTLEGAKKQLSNNLSETQQKFEVVKRLKKLREQLSQLNDSLDLMQQSGQE